MVSRRWPVTSVLLGVLAVGGCTVSSAHESPAADPPLTCTDPPARPPDTCHVATWDGHSVRYAALVPEHPSGEAVLVDSGGPGRSALASSDITAWATRLGWTRERSKTALIVLDEPWVTSAAPTGLCRTSSDLYSTGLQDPTQLAHLAAAVTGACRAGFGWDQASYVRAVEAVAKDQHVSVTSFAGGSFAAIRLGWLAAQPHSDLKRAALVNPLLPGSDIWAVIRHQAAVVDAMLASSPWASSEPESTLAAASRLASVPADAPGSLSHEKSVRTAEAARYLGLYDNGQLAPSAVAALTESCHGGVGVAEGAGGQLRPTERALAHECTTVGVAVRVPTSLSMCVVASSADAVIPLRVVQAVRRPDITTRAVHSDVDGITGCIQRTEWSALRGGSLAG